MALGRSLSWGLLRLVNLSHFALAFLAAYLTYELGTTYHVAPWWSAMMVVPAMLVIGLAQDWLFDKLKGNELASLLITFSFAVILEVAIQLYWTADYRRFETHYSTLSIKVGAFYIPVLELALCMVAGVLAWGTWLWLRKTYVGKALRAAAEDADIAAAYGGDHKKLAYLLARMGGAHRAHGPRLRRDRRHLHRADRHARAGADLGVAGRRLRRRHHRPAGQSAGRAAGRHAERRQGIDRQGGASVHRGRPAAL